MSKVFRQFATEAEAKAFVEGVEFVNDSALSVLGIKHDPGSDLWEVEMEDEDEPE